MRRKQIHVRSACILTSEHVEARDCRRDCECMVTCLARDCTIFSLTIFIAGREYSFDIAVWSPSAAPWALEVNEVGSLKIHHVRRT